VGASYEWQHRQMPCALDGRRKLSLVLGARAGLPARADLALFS
jgi:hypothetical protein